MAIKIRYFIRSNYNPDPQSSETDSENYIFKELSSKTSETALLHQIFVFKVRDFKLWLLAYFLISFNCAKFQQDWTTLILDIL